jgi:signal transduction histidine kinase
VGLTVRLRLTLLYGVFFLVSGAGLLAITNLLVANSGPGTIKSDYGLSPAGAPRGDEGLQHLAGLRQAEVTHQLLLNSVVALAVMAVVSAMLGWIVAGRVLRPLQTMTDAIQRISAQNVHERLAVTGPRDELKNLADTVDGLLGRLEAALDSHKRFVANAAHELRTPLTLEHALLEEKVMDPEATAESFRMQFKELMTVSEQQARLLESLLVLATSERGLDRPESVDLSGLTGEVLRAAGRRARRKGLTVTGMTRPAWITGDPALVERLVSNLVDNAISYNVPDGRVEVATGEDGARPFLSVTNTGPVVPPEMVGRLLSPFQRLDRTADEDGHHGIGLSVVKAIADAHQAELTVRARPAGGLAISVVFPDGACGPGTARSVTVV